MGALSYDTAPRKFETGLRLVFLGRGLPNRIELGGGDAPLYWGMGPLTGDSGSTSGSPCLQMTRSARFRFRWRVDSGTRTISVQVRKFIDNCTPRFIVKANPAIGVSADQELSPSAGTGWQTLGPITITPSSNGVVEVILTVDGKFSGLDVRWDDLDCT